MISEHSLHIQKTGRYFIIGNTNTNLKNLWIVFHGYGQLANDFIQNFARLSSKDTLIVAPEALNKFYFRGFTGKIGASWMTKEDRENEINDYVNFISSIYNKQIEHRISDHTKINVLGFSQGTHTAVRWLDRTKIQIYNLILWSGGLPKDCSYDNDYWRNIGIKMFIGNKDRMINKEHIEENKHYIKKLNLSVDLIEFNGGHEVYPDVLMKFVKNV